MSATLTTTPHFALLFTNLDFAPLLQIDFTLSVFFVVYFFVRFLAAEDKVLMLFSMESIIDFLTLPPVFLSGKAASYRKRINGQPMNDDVYCTGLRDEGNVCVSIFPLNKTASHRHSPFTQQGY